MSPETAGAGRFAPSPSGDLHIGNIRSGLLSYVRARQTGRRFLWRIEDLDRVRAGAAESQLAVFGQLGVEPDEPPLVQSQRLDRYAAAIDELAAAGRVYECYCSRKDIAQAPSAPHAPPGAYPGTCRDLRDEEREAERRRLAALVGRGHRLIVHSDTLEPEGFDVVRSTAEPAAALAMEHLLERHTRIACLGRGLSSGRGSVYVNAMRQAGLPVRDDYIRPYELSHADAFANAMQLLTVPDRPTAVYSTTDFAAIAAVGAAQYLHLRVPDDVAVIGIGNTPEGERLTPSLSTVGPTDFYSTLAEVIRARATGEDTGPGRVIEFPWTLFVRQSTDLGDVPRP